MFGHHITFRATRFIRDVQYVTLVTTVCPYARTSTRAPHIIQPLKQANYVL